MVSYHMLTAVMKTDLGLSWADGLLSQPYLSAAYGIQPLWKLKKDAGTYTMWRSMHLPVCSVVPGNRSVNGPFWLRYIAGTFADAVNAWEKWYFQIVMII
ncbi:hypothetical protein Tco_1344265 [Tanacetum coccineum]